MSIVIFACVHNAGRSQMAAAWFNSLADASKARAISAGTEPGQRVHPEVLEAMREVGIDLTNAKPQLLTAAMLADARHLVTMGCGETCPVAPQWVVRDDWPLEDPKGKPVERVREIRDEIRERVAKFVQAQRLGTGVRAVVEAGTVLFRNARRADLEEVAELARTCGLLEPGIAEAIDRFVLGRANGLLVGACGIEAHGGAGLLRTLGVIPEFRRRGIGQRLVEATLARARTDGLETTYLLTTSARAFFARLGFEEVQRDEAPAAIRGSWEFRVGCPSTALLMRRAP